MRHSPTTFLILTLSAANANAATQITSGDALLGDRGSNLLSNGSFEAAGPVGATPNTLSFWAAGTNNAPFVSVSGWGTAGAAATYSYYGGAGNGKNVADGSNSLYFGNFYAAQINETPVFNADGTVTFSGSPTITSRNAGPGWGLAPGNYGTSVLGQNISGLTIGQTYLLDFWASGEDAGPSGGTFPHDGFFQFQIAGTDSGGLETYYLAAPSGNSGLGISQRYYVEFVAGATDVGISFTNFGHMGNQNESNPAFVPTAGWTLPTTSELVLDDVILNHIPTIPEPSSILGLISSLCFLTMRRRKQA